MCQGGRMFRAIIHLLGIDTQQSWAYDFWSGVGTQITVVISAAGLWHRHNCHHRRCLRVGKHVVDGTPWCSRHQSDVRLAPGDAGS